MILKQKTISLIINYSPVLLILTLSMMALSFSVSYIQKTHALNQIHLSSENNTSNIEAYNAYKETLQTEKRLYWSIYAMGLFGFILTLLNADQMRRLSASNEDKEHSRAQLEQQLNELQEARKDKDDLRDQLFQAQKLEAVGRLAGGIAHDFNNILAAMNGYAEFLIDDLDKKTPQHGFAQNILKAGVQAREIVDKMLAFSRRDHDESLQVDIKSSIHEMLSMLKVSLPKTIELNTDITEEDAYIQGNKTQISQALMNLCVNAKDAIEGKRGALSISVKPVVADEYSYIEKSDELPGANDTPLIDLEDIAENHTRLILGRLAKDYDYISVKLSDTGSGMTRAVMEHIFEPFFTTKSVDKGTGLGLAMVHGVVLSHRGVLVINSVLKEGTTFELLFPSVDLDEDDNAITAEPSNGGTGRVLLVEDQDDVRKMMMTMLKRLGFEAECCEDGAEGLSVLRENPDYFDVVLTDQNMPNMTGVELIQATSSVYPDLPFVVLSGYSKEKMEKIMQQEPTVKALLKKPVMRDVLLETLTAVIAGKRAAKKVA